MIKNVGMGTVPVVKIEDSGYGDNRTLYLKHDHDGRGGEAHARVFAAAKHPVRVLHRGHGDVAPLHAGIGAALEEVDARDGRQAQQIVHRVDACLAHQAQTLLDVTPPTSGSQCSALVEMTWPRTTAVRNAPPSSGR